MAARLIKRFGLSAAVRWGTLACVVSLLLAISALVFGVAFFAVVASTTAFVRFNYPPAAQLPLNEL